MSIFLREVPNPFENLISPGPDGCYDSSGIERWLRMNEGTDVRNAIHALAAAPMVRAQVILTDDPEILNGVSAEDLDLCRQSGILFALRTSVTSFRELVSGSDYVFYKSEWLLDLDDPRYYEDWGFTVIRHQDDGTGDR